MPSSSLERSLVVATCLFAVLVRLATGTWGYSGEGRPPKYGDYEAQRHWMEITVHLPPRQWYVNSTVNDLSWWGLDYPPLSAYQSWLCGKFVQLFDPEAIALVTSRGHESYRSKILLRWTVILSDILVYFPAALAAAHVLARGRGLKRRLAVLSCLLLLPAPIIIDHGHFQYNCIGLGLALGAAVAIAAGHRFVGSALFAFSLNHKHMGMYYAPAFFAHLLGWCFQASSTASAIGRFTGLGVTVVSAFVLSWWPFLGSVQDLTAVLARLFPIHRGLYEDYVANFWCASSRAIKWQQMYSQQALIRMCLGATLAALVPSMAQQIRRPSPKGLLYGMASSGLAFFLFSYHVHEKGILLPLLPVAALALDEPFLALAFPIIALFSMFPLLEKDGLVVPYITLLGLYVCFGDAAGFGGEEAEAGGEGEDKGASKGVQPRVANSYVSGLVGHMRRHVGQIRVMYTAGTLISMGSIHAARALIRPPPPLPYLHDAVLTAFAFLHFAAYFLYLNYRMWALPVEEQERRPSAKEDGQGRKGQGQGPGRGGSSRPTGTGRGPNGDIDAVPTRTARAAQQQASQWPRQRPAKN